MDEKLQVMMLREIAVCVDILFNGNSNQLAKKLRKINHHHPDSLGIIHGCAWDLFMFRVMDWFSNTSNEFGVDFYISNYSGTFNGKTGGIGIINLSVTNHFPDSEKMPTFPQ
ncbi:hypothetical protein N5863_13625 [Klebsiella pasteurii]|uniref:hypothetical protein n=1 Tax=Klebsiella pasteurii TaxID=2587529 RepID=UPI002543738B|nr:hypothetical protein [Klebsiella pasteurii]WII84899.1 hypothetical protein N5863_13625 [Klebsiella pasteurii]